MTRTDLTIATPCLNESESLVVYFSKIDAVKRSLAERGWKVRHLLIDDGSTDNTRELLAVYADGKDGVRVIHHPENLGYGGAIKTAMAVCQTDWLIFVDADSNYDQGIILELEPRLTGEWDLVNVSILAPGGLAGYDRHRLLLSSAASQIYRTLLPRLTRPVYTLTCGFRAYRSATLPKIFPHSNDFVATSEIMLRALRAGLRVLEVPASNAKRDQGVSKMKFLRVSMGHLRLALCAVTGRLGDPASLDAHRSFVGVK